MGREHPRDNRFERRKNKEKNKSNFSDSAAAVPVRRKSEVPETDVRAAGGYCMWGLAMADGHGHGHAKMPQLSCFIGQWDRSLPDRHANVAPTHWPYLDFLPSWRLIYHVESIVCRLCEIGEE